MEKKTNNQLSPETFDTGADYFQEKSPKAPLMRWLFQKETSERSKRLGISRLEFIKSSMGAMAAFSIVNQIGCFESISDAQHGYIPPAEDSYAASFKSLSESSDLDWQQIEAAVSAQQPGVAATIINMLNATREVNIGFGVDQFEHMTQCATRARRDGASDEMILLCVIHDLGKVISNIAHPDIIAGIVRPYVSEGGYYLLRHHMEFQWKHYGSKIFKPTRGRYRYKHEAWYNDAVKFSDQYDQVAFDSNYATDPIEEFIPLIQQFFGSEPRRYLTASTCMM